MSFDLAVWYPQKRIGEEEAREVYVRLCDNDTSGVVAHPADDAFCTELIANLRDGCPLSSNTQPPGAIS